MSYANAPEIRDTFRLRDFSLQEEDALPASATTEYSTGIDLGALTAKGARLEDMEFEISVPDLTNLGSGGTLKFSILGDTTSTMDSGSTVIAADVLTVTGDASGEADATSVRYRLKSDFSYRYVGVKCVKSDSGDPGEDMTTRLLF